MFSRSDYFYRLPADRIAQAPAAERTGSRLLHLDRRTGEIDHHRFGALPEILDGTDLLVINDTAVVPARLMGHKETGGRAELLILDYTPTPPGADPIHRCLIRASKRPRPGSRIRLDEGLTAEVLEADGEAVRVRFSGTADFDATLHRIGRVPLPPYIRRNGQGAPCDDRTAYQTVYAERKGAVAAPTAGLHFTEDLLRRLADRGVEIVRITLHVGPGTFVPVRADDIRDHRMAAERFEIPEASAEAVNRARAEGRRVVAVGTTCVRTLEGTADDAGRVRAGSGTCNLFIYPGYRFRVVDAMITNFHLPESTLLMLVSAFAGRETILSAYRAAIESGYRFYSYGDAMFIA